MSEFTHDWFSGNIPVLQQHCGQLKDKAYVTVLEIGSFEGRSTVWLAENIANGPNSWIDAVDTWRGSPDHAGMDIDWNAVRSRFQQNTQCLRVRPLCYPSAIIVPRLKDDHYDLAYIDGSHMAADVMGDAVLSWPKLKVGGYLFFDDFNWDQTRPAHERPHLAIVVFLAMFVGRYELMHKAYQVLIKKIAR